MENYLITGGAGFIGSNFIRFLLDTDPEATIVNLDLLTYSGSLENLQELPDPSRHHFVQGDINDRRLVLDLLADHGIETIVHFAAESHVDRSIHDPGVFIETNIMGTYNLLEAARQAWGTGSGSTRQDVRFHHISTDEVYGSLEPDEAPFTENSQIKPNSPYAASKAASDHLVRSYFHTYQLPVTISNCSNNYGPYQYPEKLIPLMILNAIAGRSLPIYGDGMQIRDWLFVEDHCRAILAVIQRGKIGQTYNLGGGNQPTNLEIVHLICDILDQLRPESTSIPHRQLIAHVEDRPGHDRRYAMDTRRISSELAWTPQMSLEQGLRKTIAWYLSNQEWVTKIQRQPDYQAWVKQNYQTRDQI